jgi:hypothetical protein
VNLKPFNDKLMDIYERNMTFDGPAYLSKISIKYFIILKVPVNSRSGIRIMKEIAEKIIKVKCFLIARELV